MEPLRKTFVLREVEIDPREIKQGDIFRMEPASDEDKWVNPKQMMRALADAESLPTEEGYARTIQEDVTLTSREKVLETRLGNLRNYIVGKLGYGGGSVIRIEEGCQCYTEGKIACQCDVGKGLPG